MPHFKTEFAKLKMYEMVKLISHSKPRNNLREAPQSLMLQMTSTWRGCNKR